VDATVASAGSSRLPRYRRAALSALRAEDLLLAGWVGLANPLLAQAQGGGDPFASGQPIDGLIRLAGVAGALICLGTRTAGLPAQADQPILTGGAAGPTVGGLMLVGASGLAALGLAPEAAFFPLFGVVVVLLLLRDHLPALPTATRRALITPFVLAAGGIFWSFVRGVTGGAGSFGDVGSLLAEAPTIAPVLGILALGAAVYYAMLVYAPRQIAEREGGPLAWFARYVLFLASLVLGFGWLGLLGS
jgi:hypothetical protein